ncbi:unnamed protein product [Paramecium primaurelia]|uniref:Tetratricopeptide repeat protein n=1 Tax=Paramecium primaurelia TaxID=5886 RepID=A0A8S1QHV1_PARPR|nr:unnamed protein product [Paramecium primaurelia]
MNEIGGFRVKCSIEQHEFIELACLNKQCKANRIYCHQCLKKGDHIAHLQDQKTLVELINFFYEMEQESENLISKLCSIINELKELTLELNQGLRKKYQFSKERLQKLNARQLNSTLDQIIQFDEFKTGLLTELEPQYNNLINKLKRQIKDLKLDQKQDINKQQPFSQIIEQTNKQQYNKQQKEIDKVEKLFQKGYRLQLDNSNYRGALEFLDSALSINPNHFQSLYLKAKCLYMLGDLNTAIIWAGQALAINPQHVDSLQIIGESIREMGKFEEALKIFDKALIINPNNDFSLYLKGKCLQSLQKYQEAIIFYKKSTLINPQNLLSKKGIIECERQTYKNKLFR